VEKVMEFYVDGIKASIIQEIEKFEEAHEAVDSNFFNFFVQIARTGHNAGKKTNNQAMSRLESILTTQVITYYNKISELEIFLIVVYYFSFA
jgi:hypothetical protein